MNNPDIHLNFERVSTHIVAAAAAYPSSISMFFGNIIPFFNWNLNRYGFSITIF